MRFRYLFFSLLFLLAAADLSGQSKKRQELEAQKVRLMDEIELANRILSETQRDRKNSLASIATVEQKIKLRERLIRTMRREIKLIEEDEDDIQENIDTLQARVARQKEAYAYMIQQAYKSRKNSSRLMFILSSKDFNQALRRIEYLKQYSAYRKQKVKEIEAEEKKLEAEIEKLRLQKVRKAAVLSQLSEENLRLNQERQNQTEAIKTLQAMESDLEKDLKSKVAEAQKVEKQIQKIIAEEIARAKALAARKQLEDRAIKLGLTRGKDFTSNTSNNRLESLISSKEAELAAANKPVAKPAKVYALTPEARTLAANFEANQKRLPWPVARGLVTGNFGPQRHPVVKSVIIDNKGVDIATQSKSEIRAVFDGEVGRIFRMPDGQLAVIINHGSYFSVYQGITDVRISQGDKITKMQVIGSAYTNPISGETKLHFEIWKDKKAVNPLLWLSSS